MSTQRRWLAAAGIIYFSAISDGAACVIRAPMDYRIFDKADVIMRARIQSYRASEKKEFAVLELTPTEFLTSGGRNIQSLSAVWEYSTYQVPGEWSRSKEVIIGLRSAIDLQGRPIIQVVQQPCGPESILEDTQEKLAQVKQVLHRMGSK